MSIINMFIELQTCELRVAECDKVLKDGSFVHSLKKMKKEFDNCKEEFLEKQKNIDIIKDKCNKIIVDTKDLNNLINNDEKGLYNNDVDIRLIHGLQSRIEENKSKLSKKEELILSYLEEEEKLVKEKESLRKKLVRLKNNFYSFKEQSNIKVNDAKEEILNAKNEIENLLKQIPLKALEDYNYVKSSKGNAVATVQNGVCSGCKIKVSSITLDKIKKDNEKVVCDNCGRILNYSNDSK